MLETHFKGCPGAIAAEPTCDDVADFSVGTDPRTATTMTTVIGRMSHGNLSQQASSRHYKDKDHALGLAPSTNALLDNIWEIKHAYSVLEVAKGHRHFTKELRFQ